MIQYVLPCRVSRCVAVSASLLLESVWLHESSDQHSTASQANACATEPGNNSTCGPILITHGDGDKILSKKEVDR